MSQKQFIRITKDIGIIGITNLMSAFGVFLLMPFLTKSLGIFNYGIYVQFTVTILLISSFATLGLPYTMVRFLAGEKDKKKIQDDIYSSIILIAITSVLISFIIFLLSQSLAQNLFYNSIQIVKILEVLIPIECIGTTLLNVTRVFQQIKKYAILFILKTYSEIGFIILIIRAGYGIYEVLFSILIIRFLFLILMFIFIIAMIGIKFPSFSRIKDYLKFSLPTVPANVASWITDSSDRYIIGIYLGIEFVGYYNPGYSLAGIISMFITPIDFVLVAVVAKYYEEHKLDVLSTIFKYSIKYYLLLSIPAFLGLSVLSKPMLFVMSTPEIANQGYLVTPFIAFSMIFTGIGAIATGKILYLEKKTHIVMISWIIVAVVNLGLNLVLIPIMGIIGAAIATMIAFLTGFIIGAYFSFKYFKFDIDWISIIKIIISSIFMSVAIINLNPSTLIEIVKTILLGLFIYAIAIISLRAINKEEIKLFKSILNKNAEKSEA